MLVLMASYLATHTPLNLDFCRYKLKNAIANERHYSGSSLTANRPTTASAASRNYLGNNANMYKTVLCLLEPYFLGLVDSKLPF